MSKKPFGRLAFRAEGVWWNCYVARMDTMDEAIPMGSILLRVIEEQPKIKAQFMQTMQRAFEYMMSEITSARVKKWGEPQTAPEQDWTKPA